MGKRTLSSGGPVKASADRLTFSPSFFLVIADEQSSGYAVLIEQQAVHSNAMPLGNRTGMTAEERRELGAWLSRL